jgi:hypothetical protein
MTARWSKRELRIIEGFRARHMRGERLTFEEMAAALKVPVENLKALFVASMAERGILIREVGRIN